MEPTQPPENTSEPRQLQQPLSQSMQQHLSVGPRSQRTQSSLTASDQPPSAQENTLDRRADGSGYYEQQVFYATERNFDAKGKSYGTAQLVPLRYGVVPVRIPKTREPGHEMAYNIPFTVRRRKDSNKNGRYNVSLYDHHGSAGPQRLMKDYDHESEAADEMIGRYESFRVDYSKQHYGYRPDITGCLPSCATFGARPGIKEGDCYADIDRQQDGKSISRRQFLAAVKQAVRASARKEVVVFIHGYNVSNEGALKSAAQFVFDSAQDYSGIDYPGKFIYQNNQRVAVAFDWSSHSRPYSYGFVPCIQDDRDRAAEAGPKLAHLLLALASELSEPEEDGSCSCNGIHILAHSMGNYVLHYAMQHLSSVCSHTPVTINSTSAAAAAATAAAANSTKKLWSVKEAAGHSAVLPEVPSEVPAAGTDVAATPMAHEVAEGQAAAAASGYKMPLAGAAAAAAATDEEICPVSDDRNDLKQSDQLYQPPQQADKGLDRPQLSGAVAAIAEAVSTAASAAGTPARPATPADVISSQVNIAVPAASGTSDDPEGISALLASSAGAAPAQETAVPDQANAAAAADNAAADAGYTPGPVPSITALAAEEEPVVMVPAPSTAVPAATAVGAPETADGLTAASGVGPDKTGRRLAFRQRVESLPSPFVTSRHIHEDDSHGSPGAQVDISGSRSVPAGRSSTVQGKVAKIDPGAVIRHPSAGKLFGILKTVIHAAADVSRDDMEDTILTVRAGAMIHRRDPPQVTHYSSRRDQALCVSSFLRMVGKRKDGRAGFFMRLPSWREGHLFHPFLFTDVICVDATGFSKDPLGHGYFRDHRQVLTDIALALEGHTQPPLRSTITDSKDGEEWKCQKCNNKVAPDPKVVMYRVMTVEQQHNQQLQQCRQQLNKITRRLEALRNTQDLESWKKLTREMDLQEQQISQSVQQEQLSDAISSMQRLQPRHRGLLSMVKSYLK